MSSTRSIVARSGRASANCPSCSAAPAGVESQKPAPQPPPASEGGSAPESVMPSRACGGTEGPAPKAWEGGGFLGALAPHSPQHRKLDEGRRRRAVVHAVDGDADRRLAILGEQGV